MSIYKRDSGIWKEANSQHAKQSGIWKEVQDGYVRDSGVWKLFHSSKYSHGSLVAHFEADSVTTLPNLADSGREDASVVGSPPPTFTNGYFEMNFSADLKYINPLFDSRLRDVTNNFAITFVCAPNVTMEIDTETTSGAPGTTGEKYIISPDHGGSLLAGMGVSIGTNGVGVYEHGSNYMPCELSYATSIPSTSPTHVAVVYDNKQPLLYINGVHVRTGLIGARNTVIMGGSVLCKQDYGSFSGRFYSACYYTSSLSSSEVQDEFSYFANRYNI